ncbi:hypothetical protein [Pseudomonas alvandae]|uniref:Uncharacterized protein n=1 Tax=Pseudomonas canavaninivorans TaxID=2842348 RepID=A0ABX8QQG4_PSECO|nr:MULTISPECIES: hypothetical protein [Pseudomonas]QXI56008.1 hypothetical protein KSS97_14085 [Pseudomonas alvandae]UVM75106.1 hypothetical protein LOY40_13430 [Pseudomonas canavaninivorans]
MIIRLEEQQPGTRCLVHLDDWCVGFKNVDDALLFTRTLQARIDAPHVWPQGMVTRMNGAHIVQAAPLRTPAHVSP